MYFLVVLEVMQLTETSLKDKYPFLKTLSWNVCSLGFSKYFLLSITFSAFTHWYPLPAQTSIQFPLPGYLCWDLKFLWVNFCLPGCVYVCLYIHIYAYHTIHPKSMTQQFLIYSHISHDQSASEHVSSPRPPKALYLSLSRPHLLLREPLPAFCLYRCTSSGNFLGMGLYRMWFFWRVSST